MDDLLAHVSRKKIHTAVDPVRGRGGYASEPLRAGELICRSRPFASGIAAENLRTHCHECFVPNETLRRCTGCHQARYCSKGCQVAAWPIHKAECKLWKSENLWKALAERDVDDQSSVLLALRVFINRNRWEATKTSIENYQQQWNRIVDFCGTTPEQEGNDPFEFDAKSTHELARLVFTCGVSLEPTFCHPSDTEEFLSEIMMKMQKNNFQVVDGSFRNLGTAVYPVGALLNHSCSPNCVITYQYDKENHEFTQYIRALRPVQVDEELTHSYIDTAMSTPERRRRLYRQFEFLCGCSRCSQREASEEEDRLLQGVLNDTARQALGGNGTSDLDRARLLYLEAENEQEMEQRLKRYEECLTLQLMNLYELSLPVFMTWCRLLDTYLDMGMLDKAIQACEKICECYERGPMYGDLAPIHPMLGLQNFTLGDLLFDLCCQERNTRGVVDPTLLRRTRQVYEKALRILQVSHGPQHPLVLTLQEELM